MTNSEIWYRIRTNETWLAVYGDIFRFYYYRLGWSEVAADTAAMSETINRFADYVREFGEAPC